MKDIQNQKDARGIPLNQVGINRLATPFYILGKNKKTQSVTAFVALYADLFEESKGHHLSRFVEILHKKKKVILTPKSLHNITKEAQKKLQANIIHLEISFTYLAKKTSPVSKKESYMDYKCKFISDLDKNDEKHKIIVSVPVLLLCPCSKAISKYNAHNQRAIVTVTTDLNNKIFIEDLIKITEKHASSEIYPILKRVDEKFVTEISYENPRFVEDIVRDVSIELKKIKSKNFTIECESFESIHNHNAYAKFTNVI